MKLTRLGVDLAKQVIEVCGIDERGKVRLRKTLRRSQFLGVLAQLEPCLVGMEACGGAHHWARELVKLGHDVRLMPPQFVRPYRKSDKTDRNDAEAICEAVGRPNMRFVAVKAPEQQAVLMVHRARHLLVAERTALVNQIHGFLLEYGIAAVRSVAKLRAALPLVLENADSKLPALAREIVAEMYERLAELDHRVTQYDARINALARAMPEATRLMQIPGVGPITATAVIATVCDAQTFDSGRQFAAWVGLVPRQYSSGGKKRSGRITKRGDAYLRTLLVHGARARLRCLSSGNDPHGAWIRAVKERRGHNKAVVALAARHARTIWALLKYQADYHPRAATIG